MRKMTLRWLAIALSVVMIAGMGIALADDDAAPEDDEPTELNVKQFDKASMIADYLIASTEDDSGEPTEEDAEAAVEEIVALRTGEPSTGWGAIFKLVQLAKAKDMTLAELLASFDGEDGWAFGRHFKDLEDDERARLDGLPKNLGQLKKQERESEGEATLESSDHPGKGKAKNKKKSDG